MSSSAPRTLADQLRLWSGDEVAALLEARPDLAVPAPRDSAQLASRAVVRSSVLRALDELTALELAVLEAVAYAGPEAARFVRAAAEAVSSATDRLRARALVWGEPVRAVTTVVETMVVAGGPPPDRVPTLLAELDPAARAMLDHLDSTGADGAVSSLPARLTVDSASTPLEALVARRLLVARDERHVTLPWTVRLGLRDGRSTRDAVDVPPALALSERDPALVDRTAAGAAFELVRRTELLLDHWGTAPPGALRGGGLGVRDLKAASLLLHVEQPVAALVIETASAAGLLGQGMTDDADAAWLPTDAYDAWHGRPTAAKWAVLALAWLSVPRNIAAIGGRVADKPVNALSPDLERQWVAPARREALALLRSTAPGHALAPGTGVASVLEVLRWQRPRRKRLPLESVPATLEQAAVLGLIGLDGLSSFGRALLDDDDPVPVLTDLLPAPVDHVLLQADLTAIAPGPLETRVAQQLALLADVESRGGATVYRFAAGSVRRAFDAGWSAAEVHDFVSTTSRTPVPQALSYLIDDVSRTFGTLRAGHAEAFLRSDDETALTSLLHDPAAAGMRLRRIAPTVVVSDVPLATLLPRLRELGLAPVVEAADGTVRVARPDVFRARTPRSRVPSRDAARETARRASVVAAIRSGDRAAATRPSGGPATSPAEVMTLLRAAAESGTHVLIGYVGNDGSVGERLVTPRRVEGGRLTAYDERSDDVRSFAIHRITAAVVSGSPR